MYRPNFIESSVDSYLDECEENETYSNQCDDWVDNKVQELMEIVESGISCIDLPNRKGKETSITIDDIMTHYDSERYYQCLSCMVHAEDADHRERFGRKNMMIFLEDCLERELKEVSDNHVRRHFK